jgi:hypothetical protein
MKHGDRRRSIASAPTHYRYVMPKAYFGHNMAQSNLYTPAALP